MSSGLLGKPVKNNSTMTVNKTNSTDNSTGFNGPQKDNVSDEGFDDFGEDSYDYSYDYPISYDDGSSSQSESPQSQSSSY